MGGSVRVAAAAVCAVVGMLGATAGAANGTVIFDGGEPAGRFGLRLSEGLSQTIAADDFSLAAGAELDQVVFWTREYPGLFEWTGVVNYFVFADDEGLPGTLVASGPDAEFVKIRDAQYDPPCCTEVFKYTVEVTPAVPLAAGVVYWLGFNLPSSGGFSNSEGYWAATDPNVFGSDAIVLREDGSHSRAFFDLAFQLLSLPDTLEVSIDVKPGSDTNPIRLAAAGLVPVAVVSTPGFDATTVEVSTACLWPASDPGGGVCGPAHPIGHIEDVDGDGTADALFHFRVPDIGLSPRDTAICLSGSTTDGVEIEGCDVVTVRG